MEDNYVCLELLISRDDEGPGFYRVIKILWDTNFIPIGNTNDSKILDTIMYEVNYQDDYKATMSVNEVAKICLYKWMIMETDVFYFKRFSIVVLTGHEWKEIKILLYISTVFEEENKY